ncbi:AMP-dependent synthetase/ligase [Nocardia veterana]|uniref:Acyl-CoA synthetase n=1 Tax=Nocardia veterana TaxID=132249 RepID=A0A7X6LWU3_9NOCA|nr:AMP-binding protein [Nocardia veterana]NKY85362.1 long-chain fatty acid--CoA ligase [Nocardia veterana]
MTTAEIGFTHHTGATVRTVPEAFQQTATLRPNQVALRTVGGTQQITWADYARRVRAIAAGLAKLGVAHGDAVGIMLTNRPEFNLVDTAILHLGATPFSVYNTSSPEQIAHVFGNAENGVVITEQAFLAPIAASGTELEHVIVVDGAAPEGGRTLDQVENDPAEDFDFDAAWRAVRPDDLATLIYTSGTTGPSKGVEITHANIVAQIVALTSGALVADIDARAVSYLPAAHVADRISAHCLNLFTGVTLTCVPDPREIAAALPDARPTLFFGVPRVWQKIKAGVDAAVATEPSPVKKALAQWAIGVGLAAARARLAGGNGGPLLAVQHKIADALVLSKLRVTLGLDELKVASSGAAAIPPETLEFLLGLGFTVSEVWGMSETTGVVTIVDRKKELIITEAGKNISPTNIENSVKAASSLIGQVVAIGEGRPYIAALVVLDPDTAAVRAKALGIPDADLATLAAHPAVVDEVRTAIVAGNAKLARVEQIKRFRVLARAWEPGGVELTPTLKLKRSPIAAEYAAEIAELYTDPAPEGVHNL